MQGDFNWIHLQSDPTSESEDLILQNFIKPQVFGQQQNQSY